jgi:hypothetical protein
MSILKGSKSNFHSYSALSSSLLYLHVLRIRISKRPTEGSSKDIQQMPITGPIHEREKKQYYLDE